MYFKVEIYSNFTSLIYSTFFEMSTKVPNLKNINVIYMIYDR